MNGILSRMSSYGWNSCLVAGCTAASACASGCDSSGSSGSSSIVGTWRNNGLGLKDWVVNYGADGTATSTGLDSCTPETLSYVAAAGMVSTIVTKSTDCPTGVTTSCNFFVYRDDLFLTNCTSSAIILPSSGWIRE